jgi:hypothetical protein
MSESAKSLGRVVWRLAKFVMFGVFGFFALGAILFTVAGIGMQIPALKTEMTNRKPFADYIGREYRVVSDVSAVAWNDFPDKDTILVISLMSPPLTRNRFVSYSKPLNFGQTVRIVSAWRHLTLSGYTYDYGVNLPGAGLPERIAITMSVSSDGVPDPRVLEAVKR